MPKPWFGGHPTRISLAHVSWRVSPRRILGGVAKWLVINIFR